jgi:hypothetical protein
MPKRPPQARQDWLGWDGGSWVAVGLKQGRKAVLVAGRNYLMGIILLVLLLALILGGLGFVLHVLWWIALVVLVIWLIGFLVRVGEGSARSRWYRW